MAPAGIDDPTRTFFWGNNLSSRPSCAELIFVTDITDYIPGKKSVMWRNFRFEFEQLMEFYRNLCHCLNLCGENLCGENMTSMRSVLVRDFVSFHTGYMKTNLHATM